MLPGIYMVRLLVTKELLAALSSLSDGVEQVPIPPLRRL